MTTVHVQCDMCAGRGKLWLSGADYLECPQCEGRKAIEMQEHKVSARVRTVYVPGLAPFQVVDRPRSLITDRIIEGN